MPSRRRSCRLLGVRGWLAVGLGGCWGGCEAGGRACWALGKRAALHARAPAPADDAPDISDACREEVYQYTVKKATNINLNVPLGERCKHWWCCRTPPRAVAAACSPPSPCATPPPPRS